MLIYCPGLPHCLLTHFAAKSELEMQHPVIMAKVLHTQPGMIQGLRAHGHKLAPLLATEAEAEAEASAHKKASHQSRDLNTQMKTDEASGSR